MRVWFAGLLVVALAVTLCPLAADAQAIDDNPEAVSEYARGMRQMREGDWLSATRTFERLAGQFPNSPNLDLFVFNRAKSAYHFGSYSEAQAAFSNFLNKFGKSPLAAHARFFLGNIQYLKGQLGDALTQYLTAYNLSTDGRLDELTERSVLSTIRQAKSVSLSPSDFDVVTRSDRCELIARVVDELTSRGNLRSAKALADDCRIRIDLDSDTPNGTDIRRRGLKIAVLLPFSGQMQGFGDDLYKGVVTAAEIYRAETGRPVQLETYDTKGDPVVAGQLAGDLVYSDVDAIIGPLTSEEAAVTSAAISCGTVPMLVPAATQAGLTLLSDGTLQLSPNIELQGTTMAAYAVNKLGADSAAVITSSSVDHLRMAQAFIDEFQRLGGEVVATQYYRPRDSDFGDYIQDIKASLLGVVRDSTFFITPTGDTLEPDGVPASIDCLYLPGVSGQLRLLLPQINFYKLFGEYLGSDSWAEQDIYRLGDHITKQAVFPSPFLQRQDRQEYLIFSAAYDKRYGVRPSRLAGLGYDAANLLFSAVREGASDRAGLISALKSVTGFAGASGDITFGQYRENVEMPIYRIANERAEFIGQTDEPVPDAAVDSESSTAP